MFFILSKTLGLFTSPANIIVIIALCTFLIKNQLLKKRMAFLALGLFLFFTNQAIYSFFIRKWVVPIVPIAQIDNYDLALVLGGASRVDLEDTNRVFLNENAGDRIIHAIQLYKMGKVKKILFSSGSASLTGSKLAEANQAQKLFYMMGVPKKDLIIENKSRNTFENAMYSAEIIKKDSSLKRILLVTNGLHMKRGLACCVAVGLSCKPFPIDNDGAFDEKEWDMYVVPKMYMFSGWDRFSHEFIGYQVYRIKGYI